MSKVFLRSSDNSAAAFLLQQRVGRPAAWHFVQVDIVPLLALQEDPKTGFAMATPQHRNRAVRIAVLANNPDDVDMGFP